MKLVLKIEDQQAGSLHSSALTPMRVAAEAHDLDRALEILTNHLSEKNWLLGRGGHHIWIKHKTQYDAVQVAVIEEVPTPKVEWSVKCIGWMQGTHRFATKKAAITFVQMWRKAEGNDKADHSATLQRNGKAVQS